MSDIEMTWARMRPDWGDGELLTRPRSPEHQWEFLLIESPKYDKIAAAIAERADELSDGETVYLVAYRNALMEGLFGLQTQRIFRFVTGFIGVNDYARAFTAAVAEKNWPDDWNGDWCGYDIGRRADAIYNATLRSKL